MLYFPQPGLGPRCIVTVLKDAFNALVVNVSTVCIMKKQ